MKTNPFRNSPVAAEVTRRTHESIHRSPSVWCPAFRLITVTQHAKAWTPNPGGYALGRRSSTLFVLTLLAAAARFTHATFAGKPPPPPPPPLPSSGTLVLDLPNAYNWGLAVAPSGTIYAVGNVINAGWPDVRQVVLSSSDSGNSWSVLDDFAPPGYYVDFWGGLGGGIVSDSAGNLYVSALSYAIDRTQPDHWYVRRSTDGGATWATVDDFALTTFETGVDDVGIASDAAGNVYAVAANGGVWTVRKGVGGTLFSTVDTILNGRPKDIFVHPTGIYVVGQIRVTIKNKTSWAWLVRRSADGGATWSNVDTFQFFNSLDAVGMGIGADSAGNLYVVGRGLSPSAGWHWIVRKSSNGGNSWTTVDDYQLVTGNSSEARCIALDANGNLLVAGSGYGPSSRNWVVRKSAGGTGPWTTVDVFQNDNAANAIATDAFGNVFVGGYDVANWLIKRY